MKRLQLALDEDLATSVGVLSAVVDQVDVIEAGTLLVLREGLRSVRILRALAGERPVLADVRIAEAGGPIARLAFEAGASWVSMVASASAATVTEVCRVADDHGGEVQVELGSHPYGDKLNLWRDAGVKHLIVHRSRDAAQDSWSDHDLAKVSALKDQGFTMTVTGGVSVADARLLARTNADIVIVGRGIVHADDPRAAALAYREALASGEVVG